MGLPAAATTGLRGAEAGGCVCYGPGDVSIAGGGIFRTEGALRVWATNIISLTDSALGPRQLASNSGTAPWGLFKLPAGACRSNGGLGAGPEQACQQVP